MCQSRSCFLVLAKWASPRVYELLAEARKQEAVDRLTMENSKHMPLNYGGKKIVTLMSGCFLIPQKE